MKLCLRFRYYVNGFVKNIKWIYFYDNFQWPEKIIAFHMTYYFSLLNSQFLNEDLIW